MIHRVSVRAVLALVIFGLSLYPVGAPAQELRNYEALGSAYDPATGAQVTPQSLAAPVTRITRVEPDEFVAGLSSSVVAIPTVPKQVATTERRKTAGELDADRRSRVYAHADKRPADELIELIVYHAVYWHGGDPDEH